MNDDARVQAVLVQVVHTLVERPAEVSVAVIDGGRATRCEIRAAADDRGQIIGKDGTTIRAIRTLAAISAVAAPCRAIEADPEKVYDYTNKWNTVAVVSDGTRVLGLGDIGPKAGLPVMEGKALLYKYLGGVDGVPIMVDTKDPNQIINTVLMLQPGWGGVNLEDIAQPKCFYILDTLREKAEIPVWHDDQQGTATVTLAGLINALKVVGKKMSEVRIAFIVFRRFQCSLLALDIWLGS